MSLSPHDSLNRTGSTSPLLYVRDQRTKPLWQATGPRDFRYETAAATVSNHHPPNSTKPATAASPIGFVLLGKDIIQWLEYATTLQTAATWRRHPDQPTPRSNNGMNRNFFAMEISLESVLENLDPNENPFADPRDVEKYHTVEQALRDADAATIDQLWQTGQAMAMNHDDQMHSLFDEICRTTLNALYKQVCQQQ